MNEEIVDKGCTFFCITLYRSTVTDEAGTSNNDDDDDGGSDDDDERRRNHCVT